MAKVSRSVVTTEAALEGWDNLILSGLKREAHEGKWGRYKLEQEARKSMMDKMPEVVSLLAQWPQTYGQMKEWPKELLPEEIPSKSN